jgi:hypothetical protein
METPKTFKELFSGTGIEPTTDESGNTNYNFKATMKEQSKQQTAVEFLESNLPTAFKDLTINKQLIEQAKEMEKQQQGYNEEEVRQMLWDLGDVLFNNNQNGIKEGEPEKYIEVIIEQFKNK